MIDWFENERRGRAAIFKACCRVLKTKENQFKAAKRYADHAEIIDDGTYEIRGFHTKSGIPEVVEWSVE